MYTSIKSVASAFKALGMDPAKLPEFPMVDLREQESFIAHFQTVMSIKALNLTEDGKVWEPDWKDSDQVKYQLVIDMEDYTPHRVRDLQISFAGSRFCFRERAIAEHFVKYFLKTMKPYFTFKKVRIQRVIDKAPVVNKPAKKKATK